MTSERLRPRGRLARFPALRPTLDALIGAGAGAIVTTTPLPIALYAIACPLAIGATGGYGAPSFGASARLRTATRLALGAMVAGWIYSLLAGAGGGPVMFADLAPLWVVSVSGWIALRAGLRQYECRHPERVVVEGRAAGRSPCGSRPWSGASARTGSS